MAHNILFVLFSSSHYQTGLMDFWQGNTVISILVDVFFHSAFLSACQILTVNQELDTGKIESVTSEIKIWTQRINEIWWENRKALRQLTDGSSWHLDHVIKFKMTAQGRICGMNNNNNIKIATRKKKNGPTAIKWETWTAARKVANRMWC